MRCSCGKENAEWCTVCQGCGAGLRLGSDTSWAAPPELRTRDPLPPEPLYDAWAKADSPLAPDSRPSDYPPRSLERSGSRPDSANRFPAGSVFLAAAALALVMLVVTFVSLRRSEPPEDTEGAGDASDPVVVASGDSREANGQDEATWNGPPATAAPDVTDSQRPLRRQPQAVIQFKTNPFVRGRRAATRLSRWNPRYRRPTVASRWMRRHPAATRVSPTWHPRSTTEGDGRLEQWDWRNVGRGHSGGSCPWLAAME